MNLLRVAIENSTRPIPPEAVLQEHVTAHSHALKNELRQNPVHCASDVTQRMMASSCEVEITLCPIVAS